MVPANGRAQARRRQLLSLDPQADLERAARTANEPPELRWLTETLLFHDPTTDYRFRSLRRSGVPGTRRYIVPARKSLFGRDNQRGLPIGNLTSQFWANVYLNEVDQFAKHVLRCTYYLRYVDDMVLLSSSAAQLREWRDAIGAFVRDRLRLELRPEPAQPTRVREGVDFVGWRTWSTHRVARRKHWPRLRRDWLRSSAMGCSGRSEATTPGSRFDRAGCCRRGVRRRWRRRAMSPVSARRSLPTAVISPRRRRARLGCDPRTVCVAAISLRDRWLARAGAVAGEQRRRWLVGLPLAPYTYTAKRYTYPYTLGGLGCEYVYEYGYGTEGRSSQVTSLRARTYRRLAASADADVLVFATVGRYVEFFGPQRVLAQRVLRLRPVPIARFGWGMTAGFPVWYAARFAQRALAAGVGVVWPLSRNPGLALLVPDNEWPRGGTAT